MFEDFFKAGNDGPSDPNKYLLLEGKCDFEVMEARFGFTKSNKNAFILTLRCIDANGKTAKVSYYIMSNSYAKKTMNDFLEAIGKKALYDAGLSNEQFCNAVLGAEGKCTIQHKEVDSVDKEGRNYTRTFNNVKYFHPQPQKSVENKVYETNNPKPATVDEDDDLPF